MPQAILQKNSELAINLAKESSFIAGDTIFGQVTRKSHFVDPDASVSVRLFGRTKLKIHFSGGMTHTEYTSCFRFFENSDEAQTLYQGPINIPPNSPEHGSWPFSIALPSQANAASLKKGNETERSYLPLNDVSAQGLPPTFYVKASSIGRLIEGYVEYYLEATLVGRGKKYQSIHPLCVRSISYPTPITDFKTRHSSGLRQRVASPRLVSGIDSRISVGQKMKKILGSSQIPGYAFTLQLDFATVLQIGSPHTIPLQLGVRSIWKDTSESLQNMPPSIIVKQFTLTLLSTTYCTSKRLRGDELSATVPFTLARYTWSPKAQGGKALSSMETLIVPEDGVFPPIDLGAAIGIKTPMASREANIYPKFTTYNMRNEHHLEWKLTLRIAGEIAEYEGRQKVTVMGPSDHS